MKHLKTYESFNSDNFKQWFGNSKVVNEDGTPKVMYHGSKRLSNIVEFKPMDGKSWYFFTDSENEAWRYSGDNKGNIGKFYIRAEKIFNPRTLSEEEKTKVDEFLRENSKYLINQYSKDTLNMLDEDWESYSEELTPNQREELYSSNGGWVMRFMDRFDIVKHLLYYNLDNYIMLESELMQNYIKENGYDSFATLESGGNDFNIAVYNPNQIKSVNNKGQYSKNNDNIYESVDGIRNDVYVMYSGVSLSKWQSIWKDKKLIDKLTNVTSDIDFAFDYSYDFKTGKYDDLVVEISNIPLGAFVAYRDSDYLDDDDFETMNNLSDDEKKRIIKYNELFLVNLYTYRDIIEVKLLNRNNNINESISDSIRVDILSPGDILYEVDKDESIYDRIRFATFDTLHADYTTSSLKNSFYVALYLDNYIIGLCKVKHYSSKTSIIQFLSIDENYRGNGYIRLMVDELFKEAKKRTKNIGVSLYTKLGKLHLQKIFNEYSNKYGVKFIDRKDSDEILESYNDSLTPSEILDYINDLHEFGYDEREYEDWEWINKFDVYRLEDVKLSDLKISAMHPPLVKEYSLLETDTPPIVVDSQSMFILDGNHRAKACEIRGDEYIKAYVGYKKFNESNNHYLSVYHGGYIEG